MKRLIMIILLLFAIDALLSRAGELKANIPDYLKEPYQRNVVLQAYYQGEINYYTTGIIWDNDHILSVEHLLSAIPANADKKDVKITVLFVGLQNYKDLREIEVEIVKKTHPNSFNDFIFLKIKNKPKFLAEKNFAAPKLALLEEVFLTEKVVVIGNPCIGAPFLNTVICAEIAKILDSEEEMFASCGVKGMKEIILSYPTAPGFSGSGVWNERGELVGLVNLAIKLPDYNQLFLGGAMPADTIKKFVYSK